jgi:hypothetical protein
VRDLAELFLFGVDALDRGRQSSRVTMNTSSALNWSSTRRSWASSVFAEEQLPPPD